MLNKDKELKRRAKAQGCKNGVAISIYARGMTAQEQQARLKDYLDGKYMAVIGDEKFKEGFDCPPMKTIIDYPHASLVDKAQIIGRGARRWWNPAKGRYEGLTVIDTVVYVGSKDPDINSRSRAEALRKAISVSEILEESYVLGPAAPPKQESKSSGSAPLPWLDPNVEYYSTTEEVYQLESEISRLRREHMVEVTAEYVARLKAHITRTALGVYAMFSEAEGAPDGFHYKMVDSWLSGAARTASKDCLDWAMRKYEETETSTKTEITDERRQKLREQVERTGVGAIRVLKMGKPPEGTNHLIVQNWLSGGTKIAEEAALRWVEQKYESLPDKVVSTVKIKPEDIKNLANLRRKTGWGPETLYNRAKIVPTGLTLPNLSRLFNGEAKTFDEKQYNWVVSTLENLPEDERIIKITEKMRRELLRHCDRTGVGPSLILSVLGERCPEGLRRHTLQGWKDGRVASTKSGMWKLVIGAYRELPRSETKIWKFEDVPAVVLG